MASDTIRVLFYELPPESVQTRGTKALRRWKHEATDDYSNGLQSQMYWGCRDLSLRNAMGLSAEARKSLVDTIKETRFTAEHASRIEEICHILGKGGDYDYVVVDVSELALDEGKKRTAEIKELLGSGTEPAKLIVVDGKFHTRWKAMRRFYEADHWITIRRRHNSVESLNLIADYLIRDIRSRHLPRPTINRDIINLDEVLDTVPERLKRMLLNLVLNCESNEIHDTQGAPTGCNHLPEPSCRVEGYDILHFLAANPGRDYRICGHCRSGTGLPGPTEFSGEDIDFLRWAALQVEWRALIYLEEFGQGFIYSFDGSRSKYDLALPDTRTLIGMYGAWKNETEPVVWKITPVDWGGDNRLIVNLFLASGPIWIRNSLDPDLLKDVILDYWIGRDRYRNTLEHALQHYREYLGGKPGHVYAVKDDEQNLAGIGRLIVERIHPLVEE